MVLLFRPGVVVFGARAFGSEKMPTWLGMQRNIIATLLQSRPEGTGLLVGLRSFCSARPTAGWPTLHRALPANFGDRFDAPFYPAQA